MNMMRFILDCLRPARARAAAAARDTELQAQGEDTAGDIEIKGLQDEVHMEQETLQSTQALCRHTQESVEKLEERKTQLKEELKIIYELQKQEKEVLQSLQEEQQELEQTLQQYDSELCSAAEELLQLQREVAYAKAHAESLHVRIAPLQDVFEEIVQVKKKLSELVAGLLTCENAVTEIETEEAHCGMLDQELVGRMDDDDDDADDVDSECGHIDSEMIMSEQEGQKVNEQDGTMEDLDKMQRSLENLKSSGSSSFTEITLTEVKEEDVMFRSTTPQSDSSDMEKEDFEIIQHSQATNKEFDFFHPNPFTDGDVFGDDHYPAVDVTEQLPRDPFKGTDPFASDTLLVNMPEEKHCQDDPTEDSLPETVHYPLQSTGKDYGTFNAPINMPLGADFKHSMENFDCCVSEVEPNATQEQSDDAVEPIVDVSPEFSDECVHESGSSHSSTVFNSFDADSGMFAEGEEEEANAVAHAGSSKRVNSLCGLQSIIAGSYTGFPLSPCDPEPMQGISDIQKIFEHHIKTSLRNTENDKEFCHSRPGKTLDDNVNTPGPVSEQSHDINSNTSSTLPSICASQPSDLDVYDYKYGDMFFFTVRLDPGSPELHNHGPVCPEPSDLKKEEPHDQLVWKDNAQSPEFNDEFECSSPEPEDTDQHSQIPEDQNSPDKVEAEIETNTDAPESKETLGSDHVKVDLHIPRLVFEDLDAHQSVLDSELSDQWKASPTEAEHVSDSPVQDTEITAPKSTVQDFFCLLSNTDTSTTDPLHGHEQLTPESSSSKDQKPSCSEGSAMSTFELQYFDPFSPTPKEGVSEVEEMNTVNLFCSEAPRLDSGYHEVGTPTPFSPEPADKSKCSIDLQGPGLITSRQSDSEIHLPDPFSPESVDTGIFDSETENCESSYMMTKCELFSPPLVYTDSNNVEEKQTSFISTMPCDMLSDHLSGSELDDCCLFGSCPSNEGSYAYSSEENAITGPVRDGSDDYGESKPSSMSNDDNSSEVIHSGSTWTNSEMSFADHEAFDPMKNVIFDFSTTDVGSFSPNMSQEAEDVPHCAEKVRKKSDLCEIDYFCSELSKMVSSSSSDSVQQSVAEMLFGSEPNASSFYPWDFEKQQNSC